MGKNEDVITVIGAGYVGLSTATLLAHCGHKVYLVEINRERLEIIQSGKSFFYEEGIDPLIKEAVNNGDLVPTNDYSKSVNESSVIFSCVGTPDNPDGSSNLTYVFEAAKSAGQFMQSNSIYVQKSTVPVGTGAKIIEQFKARSLNVSYVSNPEFLREGTAIYDTLFFDRIVCGSSDANAIETIFSLYESIERNQKNIINIAGMSMPRKETAGQYFSTSLESSELIKVTSNAFLALKISFANSIAKLSDKVGADIVEVMDAVGADKRIGRAFLNAGRGYGGGCFPKDMSGLIDAMNTHGADSQILTAAQEINTSMPGYIVNKLSQQYPNLHNKKVAVLGLAFKAGTSDVRKSPGIAIANMVAKMGADVFAYDPVANGEAKSDLRRGIHVASTLDEAINGASAVLIATDWDEFRNLPLSHIKRSLTDQHLLVDCVNIYNPSEVAQAKLQYIGVGRS